MKKDCYPYLTEAMMQSDVIHGACTVYDTDYN